MSFGGVLFAAFAEKVHATLHLHNAFILCYTDKQAWQRLYRILKVENRYTCPPSWTSLPPPIPFHPLPFIFKSFSVECLLFECWTFYPISPAFHLSFCSPVLGLSLSLKISNSSNWIFNFSYHTFDSESSFYSLFHFHSLLFLFHDCNSFSLMSLLIKTLGFFIIAVFILILISPCDRIFNGYKFSHCSIRAPLQCDFASLPIQK